MPRKIQSDFNAQLKKVRGLYRRANRVRFGQGVAEGPQAVRELVTARPDLVRDIYATELALASHPDIARAVVDADFFLHVLPDSLFSEITDTGQGILGVYTIPDEPSLDDVLSNEKLVVMGVGTS
ncbi:MAG: hypothetical protein PUK40_05440, partial [Actinomycetaceae bacterium]|nr:hypothetical protein [Actinomycetaceae bacterium]